MDDDQIWSQLDLRTNNICEVLDSILDKEPENDDSEDKDFGSDDDDDDDDELDEKLRDAMRRMKNGEDVDFAELGLDETFKELILEGAFDDDDDDDDDDEGDEDEDEDDGDDLESEEEEEEDHNAEEKVALRDPSSDSEDEGLRSMLDSIAPKRSAIKKKGSRSGHPELDDDFFDLTAFNAQTEQAEAKTASFGHLDEDDEDEEEDDVDLFAPIDIEEEFDEEDADNNSSSMENFSPRRHFF